MAPSTLIHNAKLLIVPYQRTTHPKPTRHAPQQHAPTLIAARLRKPLETKPTVENRAAK